MSGFHRDDEPGPGAEEHAGDSGAPDPFGEDAPIGWTDAMGRPLRLPARTFSSAEMREIDRLAAEEFGLTTAVLMENAGAALAETARRLLEIGGGERVLVVCGPGNNGGDGYAAARHLAAAGLEVAVVGTRAEGELAGAAAANARAARLCGVPIEIATDEAGARAAVRRAAEALGADVVVDAVLGTGAGGAGPGSVPGSVRGAARGAIGAINALAVMGVLVLSADVPSGLDADTGEPIGGETAGDTGAAVRATITLTFCGLKHGFATLEAQAYVGEALIASLGVPPALLQRFGRVADEPCAGWDAEGGATHADEAADRRPRARPGDDGPP